MMQWLPENVSTFGGSIDSLFYFIYYLTAAVFILVNSLSGLTGQLVKHHYNLSFVSYWPLFVAVWCGGQLGSAFGATRTSQTWIKKGTALLVSIVGTRVLIQGLTA